jgi:hypothetical protein
VDTERRDMEGASGERGRIGRPDALSIRGGSNPSRPASPSNGSTKVAWRINNGPKRSHLDVRAEQPEAISV